MSIFKPYLEIEDKEALLHLKLSANYKVLNIFTYRILPIIILLLITGLFELSEKRMPFIVYTGLAMIILLAFWMLLIPIVFEIYFYEKEIRIIIQKTIKKNQIHINYNEIDYIDLTLYLGGRGRGAYYKLCLKNKKKITLFNLPIFMKFDKEKYRNINKKLEQITGLKINGDVDKLLVNNQ